MPYYIKERHNPQLGVYYKAQGKLTKKEAREYETGCLYGSNYMLEYKTEEEYNEAIAKLKAEGHRV